MRDRLLDEAFRFSFFQAVRLLARLEPDRAMVGGTAPPSREVVRFRTRPSLEFPSSEVHTLAENGGGRLEMTVAFMGLTGPMAALPHPYTELVIERTRYRDYAIGEFLDLFNHRLISLFYRAWEKSRFWVQYERTRDEPVTRALLAFVGLGTARSEARADLEEGLLHYAGLLANRPLSASALEAALTDLFDVPMTVEPFQGQWLSLEDEDRWRLGAAGSVLGESTFLGERIWDRQSRFRVRAGPMLLPQFTAFLPGRRSHETFRQVVRLLVPPELECDLQLVLAAPDVPPLRLRSGGSGAALGWSAWLTSRAPEADADDVVLVFENSLGT